MSALRATVICSFFIAAALSFHSTSLAVMASPDPVEVKQPNGKKFKAFIRGDEYQGWVETEQGHTVIKNPKTKVWEYAKEKEPGNLVPSGIEVDPKKSPPEGIPLHLKPKRDTEREESFKGKHNKDRSE